MVCDKPQCTRRDYEGNFQVVFVVIGFSQRLCHHWRREDVVLDEASQQGVALFEDFPYNKRGYVALSEIDLEKYLCCDKVLKERLGLSLASIFPDQLVV